MGESTASHLSMYTTMVEVVSAAFGKGSPSSSKPEYTTDLSTKTPEVFVSEFKRLMGG